ncbi:ferrous iron transport protein B [Desulfovibrio aerotolerans]|uniref:Ferrous iron transport protein B n=1 Tax=Solidesulfovibrio aerotolerans TaxID=295255 RepID=A0A7C9IJP5_9BACT|nr:ferrous iron transport protein B [Solidesulfovibrio aerotolerans]MYL81844.1 ferrous iron transport protein B [Solidesulfovibrio aerotolerans]
MSRRILAALAGQPNCGKSTVFNMLTGARQHVANFPGVTVEKKSGHFKLGGRTCELVDLPGAYSISSYSPEERVTRDFLLFDHPRVVVNVIDASNLRRHLCLTVELLELESNVVVHCNMMDVATRRGQVLDADILSQRLGVPVSTGIGRTGQGREQLAAVMTTAMDQPAKEEAFRVDYGPLEPHIKAVEDVLAEGGDLGAPRRWLAVRLLENDEGARQFVAEVFFDPVRLSRLVAEHQEAFRESAGETVAAFAALARRRLARSLAQAATVKSAGPEKTRTDAIDDLVCHKYLGPLVLIGVLFILYQVSIVWGYKLTNYTWPLLAGLKTFVAGFLPPAGMLEDPMLRSLGLWFMDSVNSLLNYIPIFFLLFFCVAFLEDTGYMPRMAFILDRLFRSYGLHGQSTLPMVLAGVYLGGCCVPGVMACKAIPDDKSRLATILIIPLMNCLAKVPLYILLVGAFFPGDASAAMFFISTVTLFMALPIARLLSSTLLSSLDSAPFIMEMPPYHLPTLRNLFTRAIEKVALFVQKIITVVAAVAIIIFVLLQFPGISREHKAAYQARLDASRSQLDAAVAGSRFQAVLAGDGLLGFLRYEEAYKAARAGVEDAAAAKAIDTRFREENPDYFAILKPRADAVAKAALAGVKAFAQSRDSISIEMRRERLETSFLGILGRALEPVTQFAGFNWRVNAGLLSAFAAKESAVATMGAIYKLEAGGTDNQSLEASMRQGEADFTPLHALALMLFMALYPPCMATSMMIKVQTGQAKWMVLAILYPMVLGIIVASAVFTGGRLLGLDGNTAMWSFYGLAVAATIVAGLIPHRTPVTLPVTAVAGEEAAQNA